MRDQDPGARTSASGDAKIGKWMLFFAWLAGLGLLTLLFDDQLEQQFNPNRDPQSSVSSSGTEVRLKQNRQGHYVTTGIINNEPVIFLLDTGATDVSIPYELAERLALQPGARQRVRTANGTIMVASTRIRELSIGDIQLYNIDANLNPGMRGNEILLGMSALKQLEFTQKGEWLILRQGF